MIMTVVLGHDHDHAGESCGHGGHSHGQGVLDHDHSHYDHDHDHDLSHGVENSHGHGISIAIHHYHSKQEIVMEEHEPLHKHSEESLDGNSGFEGTREKNEKRRNINVHGAYLHVLGDSIQSIGVLIGGAIIWYTPKWKIIDLICTLIFFVVVLLTTIKMLRNILEVLMESTPWEIDATRIEKGLCKMDGVVAIHELHIWAITMGNVLLACHVTITPEADADCILDEAIGYIRREYNISHVTIQIERL